MAKYHITTNGQPAKCTAKERACPLGGTHYDSPQDAAVAVMEADFNSVNPPNPDVVKVLTAKQRYEALDNDEVVSDEDREEFYGVFLKDLERDTRGQGITHFGTGAEALRPEEFAQLLDAMKKPLRLTNTEKKNRDELCREHKVLPEEVEAWANETHERFKATWQGQVVEFHPSRQLTGMDVMGSFGSGKRTMGFSPENVAAAAKWKRDRLTKQAESGKAETTPVDQDPRHRYGSRNLFSDQDAPTARREAKPLDPQMIEALKLKYLKKFKQPFDESGLSIPELLQMAQKGELG